MELPPHKAIWMVREDLDALPQFPLPRPFSFRWYQEGDRAAWEDIQIRCEDDPRPFPPDLFDRAYGMNFAALPHRMLFLLDERQQPIGGATAWLDEDFDGKLYGRIHWVAILREYQGRGLAKPLMSTVCSRLRELGHERACLRTSTGRILAINLYRKFGFVPLIRNADDATNWKSVPVNFGR